MLDLIHLKQLYFDMDYFFLTADINSTKPIALRKTKIAFLRPDFTSKLVHVLAFGTLKFYIAPYDKIKHELVNLSSNCDVKSRLSVIGLIKLK